MKQLYGMGNIIKEKRKALALTQKELAEILGVSDKAVSKWERCESMPDISLIPSLAIVLNVSIDYLLTGEQHLSNNAQKSENLASGENTALAAATALANKINAKYIFAICFILTAVAINFWVNISLNGQLVQLIAYDYRPFFYTFVILLIFILYSTRIKNDKELLSRMGGHIPQNSLGTLFYVTVITSIIFILILMFKHYVIIDNLFVSQIQFIDKPTSLFAKLMGAENEVYGITAVFSQYARLYAPVIYILSVITAIFFSREDNLYDKSVPIISFSVFVLFLLHRIYYSLTAGLIIVQKVNINSFYFEYPATVRFLEQLNIYNLIYSAIVVTTGAIAVFVVKGRLNRIISLIFIGCFGLFLIISAFGFIDGTFDGMGGTYARLIYKSVMCGELFVIICPHLLISAKGIIKKLHKI